MSEPVSAPAIKVLACEHPVFIPLCEHMTRHRQRMLLRHQKNTMDVFVPEKSVDVQIVLSSTNHYTVFFSLGFSAIFPTHVIWACLFFHFWPVSTRWRPLMSSQFDKKNEVWKILQIIGSWSAWYGFLLGSLVSSHNPEIYCFVDWLCWPLMWTNILCANWTRIWFPNRSQCSQN